MPLEELPRIDEHAVTVAAAPDAVWTAVLATLRSAFAPAPARGTAALLGCDPAGAIPGWDRGEVGSAIPGFRVVTAQPPRLLVVAGRHRFSRYGIVVRIDDVDGGARCRLESLAEFPGLPGGLYRLAVVRTGFHAIAVERLVRQIGRAAVRPRGAEPPGGRTPPR